MLSVQLRAMTFALAFVLESGFETCEGAFWSARPASASQISDIALHSIGRAAKHC